ncbi:MAG: Prolipoprotein diacylglyceryl transferase [Acidobacteria bacterium ADurb.Bin340]|nr:MAG: Prolipoprotein diacylglyceryl transferase [Acidobacteria bacterium ADurb.Bin340]
MHPILFRIGSFEVGTYGLLVTLAFFAAMYLAMRLGRQDGLEAEAISDLSVTMLLAGIVGAKGLMIVVDLMRGAPVSEVFSLSTLRAAGAIHGGIILGTVAFFWRVRRLKLPLWPTLDAFAAAVPLGQALGRVGCFFAGCCFGTTCDLPWAVTFHNHDAVRLSGTPLALPLHPVQLYTVLFELALAGALLLGRRWRRFPGQLIGAFFIAEGIGRAVLETFRGDLDRGAGWLGQAWLSTGRITGLLFVGFGAALLVLASRRKEVR